MSNPKYEEERLKYIDKYPFLGLEIDNNSVLNELEGRHPCLQCGKSRKFYCYTCYIPLAELEGKLPVVKVCQLICIPVNAYFVDFSCQLKLI